MSSTVSSCQHHVCKSCVGGKMRLKPSCSWCKDHSNYNNLNTNGNRISSITSIGNGINIVGNLLPSITLSEAINGDNTKTGIILKAGSAQAFTLNRNIIKADSTQLNKILTGTLSNNSVTNNNSNNNNNNNTSTTLTNNNSNQTPSVNRKVRRGCRCGLATPNPGKLACCGQRCPCYVESKACNQCKCRGCRNPNKVSNLTTINIISTSSSTGSMLTSSLTSSTPSTSSITSTSNIITPLITSTTSNSLATSSFTSASKQTESALITIPSLIAANLFKFDNC
ncbi:rhoGEF domain-containing protein gxcJ-like [Panonychus citri]|uniref:rhoGEF domain-containing protein gxcJ-like n=1 Tax=Panonychus citri TaxID=50023 RepID=UPI0023072569|nr:rhoGEF domain-containing protein gxcJ-like [Panonychus citri]